MKPLFKLTGTLLPILLFCIIAKADNFGDGDKRDTSVAVVVYDSEQEFLPVYGYVENDYEILIDSLLSLDTIPINLINQLHVYSELCSKDEAELVSLLDSLFEEEKIPKHYLNSLNIYMASHSEWNKMPRGISAYVPYDHSHYPANVLYGTWNTEKTNPYSNCTLVEDDGRKLLLVDSLSFCEYVHPFEGMVTSQFGFRYYRDHNGIDVDLEVGDPVKSAFSGMVRVAKNYTGYGRVVVVRHYNGLETLYAHLHRIKVKPGDLVEAGDIIGLGGNSGNSTGSHLHFEVRYKGRPLNPASIIDFSNFCLIDDYIELRKTNNGIVAIPESVEFYQVKKNDYLYKIAVNFGVSIDELCEINGISRNSILKVGQKVRISS